MSSDGVTVTLRTLTFGDGTDYCWGAQGISGLGEPPVRNNDVIRGHADGSVGQNDYRDVRLLTFDVVIGPKPDGTLLDPADVLTATDALIAAWAPSDVDLTLAMDIFGTVWTFLGRPDGLTLDTSALLKGLRTFRALGAFRCPDPARY